MNIGPQLLGRTVEHDPRNKDHPFPVRRLAKPVNRNWTCGAPILDQGEIGSCEGNTAAEWLNCSKNLQLRRQFWVKQNKQFASTYLYEPWAVKFYSKATALDNDDIPGVYPPEDTGTSAVGIAKSMQSFGAISSYQWTFGWDHFLAAIDQGPVMLGTNWYSGMFDPDSRGYVNISGSVDGGHAYLARSIDFQNQRVRCRNHWTSDWGLAGEFWLKFPTLQRLLVEEGDVLVPR
jgi:hypothetical protein